MRSIVCVVATLAVLCGLGVGLAAETPSLVAHAPIWINGNYSFTKDNGVVAGRGTSAAPFVIEGWLFEQGAIGGGSGIGIQNTDAYFVIRHCRFVDMLDSPAISFSWVSHGRVEDCVVEGTRVSQCILLNDSTDCAVVRCDLTNAAQPAVVALWGCTRIAVADNSLRSVPKWTSWCGVAIWGTTGSSVSRNEISDCGNAVALNHDTDRNLDSVDNTVDSNTMSNSEWADVSVEETSARNQFFYNNLESQTGAASAAPMGANAWDNGTEGNYWSGLGNRDSNSDGIEDAAHYLGNGDTDRYPLMRPWRSGVVLAGIQQKGSDERVTIRNWGPDVVQLAGWKLESVDSGNRSALDTLCFTPGLSIPAGGILIVHSGPASKERANEGIGTATAEVWGGWQQAGQGQEVWDDACGIVALLNAGGAQVDELEYGSWNGAAEGFRTGEP